MSPSLWPSNRTASNILRSGGLNLLLTCLCLLVASQAFGRAPLDILQSGRAHYNRGAYGKALASADTILTSGAAAPYRIAALALKAETHKATGHFSETDRDYKQALDIFHNDPLMSKVPLFNNRNYANLLFNYAQFQLSMGQYDECLETLLDTDFPMGSEGYLRTCGLLANLLYRTGEPLEALKELNKALEHDTVTPTTTMLLQNRGYILTGLKEYESAYNDLATAISRLDGKEKHIAEANAAMALAGMKRYDEALKISDQALKGLKKIVGERDADYLIALRKRGEILKAAGRDKESAECMRRFFTLERDRLAALLPGLTPQMRLDYWTREKPLLSRCFIVGDTDPELMFDVALMRRETSLLGTTHSEKTTDRLYADMAKVRRSLAPDAAAVAFITYRDMADSLQYAALTLPKKGKPRFLHLFPESFADNPRNVGMKSLREALQSEDPKDKNRLYRDTLLAEMVWRPILDALPRNTRHIHFAPEGLIHLWGIENMPFRGDDRYMLTRHFSLLDIGDDTSGLPTGNSVVAGGLDYDMVPQSDVRDDYPNRETSEVLRRSLRAEEGTRFFTPLPGTAIEADSVAHIIPNSLHLTLLSEEDFKHKASRYRALHLATHGFSLDCGIAAEGMSANDSVGIDLSLLRSGLALSGANALAFMPDREDGIISAREICDLDLSGVDMVVLSACQTAKGLITDESASGLIRALKNAGARTIVASLWEVDDRATMQFMTEFYKALRSGMSRQKAMDAARRNVRDFSYETPVTRFNPARGASVPTGEYITTYPFNKPFYWAPFILIDP